MVPVGTGASYRPYRLLALAVICFGAGKWWPLDGGHCCDASANALRGENRPSLHHHLFLRHPWQSALSPLLRAGRTQPPWRRYARSRTPAPVLDARTGGYVARRPFG